MTESPLAECPECRGKVRRLIGGGAGFILKGTRHSQIGQNGQDCSPERIGKTCCGREALSQADWVSLKVDAVRDMSWLQVNRPRKTMRLPLILDGILAFAKTFTGDAENDFLSITAVHPMREEAVGAFLSRAGASWEVVDRLVARGDLAEAKYDRH